MKLLHRTLSAALLLAIATASQAGELGDTAPKLDIKQWVKGDAVDVSKNDGKQVYVVEFWATWCPPCRTSIPHLTEMQKKLKNKNVTVIGVSVDRETDKVAPFVKEWGDKMDYVVAIDNEGATYKAYAGAFGIETIPHAFVVDQKGRLVWQQNPADPGLEKIVEQVADGKFQLEDAKKIIAADAKKRQQAIEAKKLLGEYLRLVRSAGNEEVASALGAKIVEMGGEDPGLMNRLAWDILTNEEIVTRDLKLARSAAEAANNATHGEDASILDTYALALFKTGDKDQAVKAQEKAVNLAKEQGGSEQMIKDLEERLTEYRE